MPGPTGVPGGVGNLGGVGGPKPSGAHSVVEQGPLPLTEP